MRHRCPSILPAAGPALAVAFVCLLAPSGLAAQNGSDDAEARTLDDLSREQKAKFVELVEAGKQAYSAGNFEEAAPYFERAYQIVPRPELHYRLALCHERAGHPKKALTRYRRFLEEKPESDKRGAVETTIERLEASVRENARATVRVETTPEAAGLTIRRAGDEASEPVTSGTTPIDSRLDPGPIVMRVEKDGYEPTERRVDLEAGETYNFSLTLDERSVSDPESPPPSGSSKTFPTVVTIVGATGAATAATLYGIGLHCDTNRRACRRGLYDTAATGSYIAGGVAAVGLGTSLFLWMDGSENSSPGSDADPPASVRLRLRPTGLDLSARF